MFKIKFKACKNGRMETVSLLIENKANVNEPNKTGRTALMRGLVLNYFSIIAYN